MTYLLSRNICKKTHSSGINSCNWYSKIFNFKNCFQKSTIATNT